MSRWAIGAVALLLVAGAAVAAFLLLRSDDDADQPSASATTGAPQVDWAQEGPKVEEVVRSLPDEPQAALAPAALKEFRGKLDQALPPGTRLTPVKGSWAPDYVGGGTLQVTAEIPGRPTQDYLVVLERIGGQWKVLATVPVTS